jgi:hypothetical protein
MNLREKLFLLSATILVAVIVLSVLQHASFRSLPLAKKSLKNRVRFPVVEYAETPFPVLSDKPVPSFLEGKAGDVTTRLTLRDDGDLVYTANAKEVWTLRQARQMLVSPETDVLKTVQMAGQFPVVASSGLYALHISPLCITKSKKPHWTMFGGLEAADTSSTGNVFLMSSNRLKRAALMDNGDIVVLSSGAKGKCHNVRTCIKLIQVLVAIK